jgi:hypothetical protein
MKKMKKIKIQRARDAEESRTPFVVVGCSGGPVDLLLRLFNYKYMSFQQKKDALKPDETRSRVPSSSLDVLR